jgi:TMEM175 potassium channel family protein
MGTSRLETFADGVLAIAATLLILDVSVSGSPLSTQLARAWPSYVAYMVSFITIGIIWVNHHAIMDQVARCDRTFLVVNVFFLMVVAFIPFPTRLVAQHLRGDGAEAAAFAYGVTLTLTAVFFNILWFYAARGGRLLREDADPRVVRGISRSYRPGPWIYLAATLIAFANPHVSLALFAAFALFYVLESSLFGRDREA